MQMVLATAAFSIQRQTACRRQAPPPAAPAATTAAALQRPRRLLQLHAGVPTASRQQCKWQRQQWGHTRRRLCAAASSSDSEAAPLAPLALSSGESDGSEEAASAELAASSRSSSNLPGAAGGDAGSPLSSSPDSSGDDSCSDSSGEGGGVQIDLQLPRRSLLVQFTCNKCEGRTERLVNPVAWNRGMVIAQCQHCQVWHKLADAANLVQEIRYADLEQE